MGKTILDSYPITINSYIRLVNGSGLIALEPDPVTHLPVSTPKFKYILRIQT